MNPEKHPDEIRLFQTTKLIRSTEEFLRLAAMDKDSIQILSTIVPWNQNLQLVDCILNTNILRNQIYSNCPGYRINMRSNNTIIRVFNPENPAQLLRSYFGKRGLPLVPELTPEVLQHFT
jgi:hypothetical protein